jgi:hypothetical protein
MSGTGKVQAATFIEYSDDMNKITLTGMECKERVEEKGAKKRRLEYAVSLPSVGDFH